MLNAEMMGHEWDDHVEKMFLISLGGEDPWQIVFNGIISME